MNKQEFVDRLRMALNGHVSPGLVMDNVNYYQDYINTEIRKGRTEEEVLESLGDPRLIARTIIQTNGGDNRSGYRNTVYGNGEYREADPWDSGGSIDLRCGIFRIVFSGTGTDSDCGSIVPGEIISGLA
mgnify:CR=1 FL=1